MARPRRWVRRSTPWAAAPRLLPRSSSTSRPSLCARLTPTTAARGSDDLALEARRSAGRQVRRRVDGLLVDAQLEVEMRTGGIARRPLEPDRLALDHPISELDDCDRQVAVQGVQPAGVGDDDKVAITAARAADQRHDAVVGRVNRRAERFDHVDAGMEMRVAAVWRFEPE